MKTLLILPFIAAAFARAAAEPTPAPSLRAETGACCQAVPAQAPLSKESIYQAGGSFTDDSGQAFALGSLRGRPVVLSMFFTSCGYACPLTVTAMLDLQQRLPAALRDQAVFVLVSFDVAHDTSEVLAKYREQRHLGGNWILLRGDDASVRELAALLGVQYRETANGMFAHTNQITVLNREGEIVHERKGLAGGIGEAARALAQING
jgi:protein SCO1/2